MAPRRMVVLDPLKVVIENYEGDGEYVLSENLPKNEAAGRREVRFSREIILSAQRIWRNAAKVLPPGARQKCG